MIIINHSNPKFEVIASFSIQDKEGNNYNFLVNDYLSVYQTQDAVIIGNGPVILAIRNVQDIVGLVKNLMQFSPEIKDDGEGEYIANKLLKHDIKGRVSDMVIKSAQRVIDVYNYKLIN